MAFLAQIKVCWAAIMERWRRLGDMDAPPSPWNCLYVYLNDGWGPLRHWVGILTAPHIRTPVQAAPTGSSTQFAVSEAGFAGLG